ncbi:MAG TPA: hypothetical protein VFA56_04205 [Gaiellaceae bacterium]|nr:hypothetical protein [Gaiellaceae bacterium]
MTGETQDEGRDDVQDEQEGAPETDEAGQGGPGVLKGAAAGAAAGAALGAAAGIARDKLRSGGGDEESEEPADEEEEADGR